jgi:hypothetical protein
LPRDAEAIDASAVRCADASIELDHEERIKRAVRECWVKGQRNTAKQNNESIFPCEKMRSSVPYATLYFRFTAAGRT